MTGKETAQPTSSEVSAPKQRASAHHKEPTLDRGVRRVELLLSAAEQLFGEIGYGAASMNEIARRAESSVGSLYQFFRSKDAIAVILIERYTEELEALWEALPIEDLGSDCHAFSATLVTATMERVTHQKAFSTLEEARVTLGLVPGNFDRLARAISQLVVRFRPEVLPEVSNIVGQILLQTMTSDLQAEQNMAKVVKGVRYEFILMIAAYLTHRLGDAEPTTASKPRTRVRTRVGIAT